MRSQCSYSCERSEAILELLMDNGANVHAIDSDGHTALDAALEANKSEGKFEK